MNSAFFELNVAMSGLFTAKNVLEVTSHNISNMATEGYTRQVAYQRANKPAATSCAKGMIGTGSEVYSVGQIRDFYLDQQYYSKNSNLGENSTKTGQINLMETIFNSLSDAGITQITTDFFNSLSSLTFSAGDSNYRTSIVNCADSFAKGINSCAESLLKQQKDLNEDMSAVTTKINALSNQILSLNKQIYSIEGDGSNANDLRDQRALLVDELSGYVNTESREIQGPNGEKDKRFVVYINGQELVNHFYNNELTCVKREERANSSDADGIYDMYWKGSGKEFNTKDMSGELRGIIDIRDGNGSSYNGIPYYVDKLNSFVQTVAKAFNEGRYSDDTDIEGVTGHIYGYDADGETGNLFFSYIEDGKKETNSELDYNSLTAFNFCISEAIEKSPLNVATSTNQESPESDNELILGLITIKDKNSLFQEGNIYDFVNGLSSVLGIDSKQATKFEQYYTDVVSSVDNQRLQVSGVSLNEEIVNLVKYQHLYAASSKAISVINNLYSKLINETGV